MQRTIKCAPDRETSCKPGTQRWQEAEGYSPQVLGEILDLGEPGLRASRGWNTGLLFTMGSMRKPDDAPDDNDAMSSQDGSPQ